MYTIQLDTCRQTTTTVTCAVYSLHTNVHYTHETTVQSTYTNVHYTHEHMQYKPLQYSLHTNAVNKSSI